MITLKQWFNTNVMFDKLTVMLHQYNLMLGKSSVPVYTYYMQLNHKHKRMRENAIRLLNEYGNYIVDQIEWQEDGNIVIKISENGEGD